MSDSLEPFAESKRELMHFNSDNLPAFVWGYAGQRVEYMRGVLWALNQQRLGDDWLKAKNELCELTKHITGIDQFDEAIALLSMIGPEPKDKMGLQIQSQFFQAMKDEPRYGKSLDTYIKARKALDWLMMNIRINNGDIDDAFAYGQMNAAKWAFNQRCFRGGFEYVKEGYVEELKKTSETDIGKFLFLAEKYHLKDYEAKAIVEAANSEDKKFIMGVINALGIYYMGEAHPMDFELFYYNSDNFLQEYFEKHTGRKSTFQASRRKLILIIDQLCDKATTQYPELVKPTNT